MAGLAAILLAAGQGKRMKSPLPKVLHRADGRPLIQWVVDAARDAGAERIIAVLGVGKEQVERELPPGVDTALQAEQLGTGHAARCAEEQLKDHAGPIAVLCGDMPLLRAATVRRLAEERASARAALSVLTAVLDDPASYGRIVRDADGGLERIVEFKDATPGQRRIREINTGAYVFAPGELFPVLARLRNDNAQREYYLTDAVSELRGQGKKIVAVVAGDPHECIGVNTPDELAAVESALRARRTGGAAKMGGRA